uniref:Uncharacterized protein n=1 Tax=Ixodes ricinus TaxID=34613 RepID=A0A6B0U4W8_IXORI
MVNIQLVSVSPILTIVMSLPILMVYFKHFYAFAFPAALFQKIGIYVFFKYTIVCSLLAWQNMYERTRAISKYRN